MAEPPKPPPVIRAPMAPAPRATSTARSSSAQEISKSSRMERWLASSSAPIAAAPRLSSSSTVPRHAIVFVHDVADPAEGFLVEHTFGPRKVGGV